MPELPQVRDPWYDDEAEHAESQVDAFEEFGHYFAFFLGTMGLSDNSLCCIWAKDAGFGLRRSKSDKFKTCYGVTSSKDYAVTSYNEEMNHHTLLQRKASHTLRRNIQISKDGLSESALRRNVLEGLRRINHCKLGCPARVIVKECRITEKNVIITVVMKWLGNMMCEADMENLTIEQYLMLTQGNQTHGMVKNESGGMMKKDTENMTIAEYIEYEAEMKRQAWKNAQFYRDTKMEKRMCRHDKENEEDTLIDILKTLVSEYKTVYTNGNTRVEVPSYLGASVNVMPKSVFEHLKLASLKETNMVVEMADMMKKSPLRIVENILVKIDRFLFPSDFVIIDMIGGIGEDRVKFDMDGDISHSEIPVEKIYMASFVHEVENFNPLEIENDVFSYESPACMTLFMEKERMECLNSGCVFEIMKEKMLGVVGCYLPISLNFDVEVDFGKILDDPYSRRFDKNKEEFESEIEQLENEYDLRVRMKKYAMDDIWEKCERFQDAKCHWYDEGFEEEE
ncbi:phospholipase-like protein [Tanacetum coccineum]